MTKPITPLLMILLVLLQVNMVQAFLPAVSMIGRSTTALLDSTSDQPEPRHVPTMPTDLGIHLTDNAWDRLREIRASKKKKMEQETGKKIPFEELFIRFGVKKGGCKGMSYTMEFIEADDVKPDDLSVEKFCDSDRFGLVTTKADLLYLYGLRLDYSDDLVGGGFKFDNPNANKKCSCGTSFAM
eukprot:Nitzschia sp. Nitz4//scaffold34_size148208//36335//36886//NITZ4_002967-RA/size148208-processed-gene-0.35-mRNA-1//-1//CDS//3329548756//2588//frame0